MLTGLTARLVRRVVDALLVVWLVATVSFVLLRLAPGDPVSATLSDARVPANVRAEWRVRYQLDQPIRVQYAAYVRQLAQADLGYSFSQSRPVAQALRDTVPWSLLLMGLSLIASVTLGALLGLWQALRVPSVAARGSAAITSALSAMPEAWMSLVLLALFGAQLALFPLSGRCDPRLCDSAFGIAALIDAARHLALPVLTLTLLLTATFARVQRVALRDVLHDDVMRTARAHGVPPFRRIVHYGARRAARPLVASVALSLPMLIGGAVFVERVFSWPGMGMLLVNAIGVRDYPLVTATAILGSLLVVCGTIAADVLSAWLDPRWGADAP